MVARTLFLLLLTAGAAHAASLPIRAGSYVLAGTACEAPPFAATFDYDDHGFSYPHATACRSVITSRERGTYRVRETCSALRDGSPAAPSTKSVRYKILSRERVDVLGGGAGSGPRLSLVLAVPRERPSMIDGPRVERRAMLAAFSAALAPTGRAVRAQPKCEANRAMTTHHRTVRVGELDIFYREAGPADAPVILLLHGYPSSSFMFRDLIPLLSDSYRLLAPDFPGFGYSDAPDPDRFTYTFDRLADVVEGFTDVLGLTRYALYMQDYGGPVGLRWRSGVLIAWTR